MQVTVVSETIQEFEGRRYYFCGHYFQRKGKRLHRVVWETLNGPVPSGFHVHHLDHDATNNQPNNLALLRDAAHLSHHSTTPQAREHQQRVIKLAQAAAPEWHRSAQGKAWHSKNAKAAWVNHPVVVKQCQHCGTDYETPFPSRSKFCHLNCKMKALRKRRSLIRTQRAPSQE